MGFRFIRHITKAKGSVSSLIHSSAIKISGIDRSFFRLSRRIDNENEHWDLNIGLSLENNL